MFFGVIVHQEIWNSSSTSHCFHTSQTVQALWIYSFATMHAVVIGT